jgi:CTP:molybdopterin cytidylyltransferase MocA
MTAPERPALAVIPARGGSKRVPRKNVRELAGRPLIAYTVEAALDSGVFARVVVSTDDEEIARIGRACGAEAPFLRAASLSDDVTPVSAATADALGRLDPYGTVFADVAQLMANCPLRTAEDIRASHVAFRRPGPSRAAPRPGDVRHSLANLTLVAEAIGFSQVKELEGGLEASRGHNCARTLSSGGGPESAALRGTVHS